MRYFLAAEVVVGLTIVLASVAVTRRARRSRARPTRPESLQGFTRTDEAFFDPTTGVKQEVWFNPHTGERRYRTIDDGDERGA